VLDENKQLIYRLHKSVNEGRRISTIMGFFVIAHTSTGASRKRIRRYLGKNIMFEKSYIEVEES
jgi:hypothetical protein